MITEPMLYGRVADKPLLDGREGLSNTERSFWQSRMTSNGVVAELPQIIHPKELCNETCPA